MPLSWNEIRDNALKFSAYWSGTSSEGAEAKVFWHDFFKAFGVDRKRVATFEYRVNALGDRQGYVDLLWKGVLLVEHKSRGKDLDRAFAQAKDYFPGLKDWELPRHILVCDFHRFRLYDLEADRRTDFPLDKLHEQVKLLGFLVGAGSRQVSPQDPVNVRAAERMGHLHDRLKDRGGDAHALEVVLVRLLFCLFAEDTGIFPRRAFQDFVESRSREDGADLGAQLGLLFQVLDTPPQRRPRGLDEELAALPYVGGGIFGETLPSAFFDRACREALLAAAALDWGRISPAIFGALFQSAMDPAARRQGGAHYTSEENIRKVIGPLFLDDLWAEFDGVGGNVRKLEAFHARLGRLTFLDPACGCGNFLVVAYRELRLLELQVMREMRRDDPRRVLDIGHLVRVDVGQFHGIELGEFPARIAETALWLTDHQVNLKVSEEFGQYFARLPLTTAPHIVHGNALRVGWPDADFIFGNPPFVGSKFMSLSQRADLLAVCDFKGAGVLDYVSAWYVKAARHLRGTGSACVPPATPRPGHPGSACVPPANYTPRPESGIGFQPVRGVAHKRGSSNDTADIQHSSQSECAAGIVHRQDADATRIRGQGASTSTVAFVSTNSITQGEQVGVLWKALREGYGVHIRFAHRTFRWSNEARGRAAVFCVVVGFGLEPSEKPVLFDYETPDAPPVRASVGRVNPYLVDAPDAFLPSRNKPLCAVPEMGIGNKPIDGGHYLFTAGEKDEFLRREPLAATWFRRWLGADEFINGHERWCLWLGDCPPNELRRMPEALKRVESVRKARLASRSAPTRKLADTPARFHVENMPKSPYLVIPEVSSERRYYIPIGFVGPETICSNLVKITREAGLYHFGIISSLMHMAWVRAVSGRLESRYRYSASIVYNNFPWPDPSDEKTRQAVESAARGVLSARAAHHGCTLADLYDPLATPQDLLKAHQAQDRAVDRAYGIRGFPSEAARVAHLFDRYRRLCEGA